MRLANVKCKPGQPDGTPRREGAISCQIVGPRSAPYWLNHGLAVLAIGRVPSMNSWKTPTPAAREFLPALLGANRPVNVRGKFDEEIE
jgi:hypothetical protein